MSLICNDLEKRGWNTDLCCPVCHNMGRFFTCRVRYKKTKQEKVVVTCCKGMRAVFDNDGWDLLSYSPDDMPFFECADGTQRMKPKHVAPHPVIPIPVRLTRSGFIETHRRRSAG